MAQSNSLQKHQSTQAVNSAKSQCAISPPNKLTQSICHGKSKDDDTLVNKAKATQQKVINDKSVSKDCKERAKNATAEITRFNSYRDALPYARAANELNKLGDEKDNSGEQYKRQQKCITMLPADDARALNKELCLPPGTITDKMLRDDDSGFRAAIFRDEASGKLILVGRDTQPDSMVDWQTNTRNGEGLPTPQYEAMRELTETLKDSSINFDISGYSKGGGLAQEAALINKKAKVYLFNSAGLHENSLTGSGYTNFNDLASRARSFSAEGEFLTFMNNTTDLQQQITNGEFLRNELAGEGSGISPMKIKYRNPAMRKAYDDKGWFDSNPDPSFKKDLNSYLSEMDTMLQGYRDKLNRGESFKMFPPVHTAHHETVVNSQSSLAKNLPFAGDINSNQPNLAKMVQHQMTAVLNPMEESVRKDRLSLSKLVRYCGQ